MSSRILNLKLKGFATNSNINEIDLGLSLDKLNLGRQKKLLILSLGGLLVHRIYRRDRKTANQPRRRDRKPANQPRRCPDAIVGNFLVFKRPFCSEFLQFCSERFEVGIWSSAKERNVNMVLSELMEGWNDKLILTWDQKKCTNTWIESLEKKEKTIFLKDITKVWAHFALKKYSSSNTLMVEEEHCKCLLNPDQEMCTNTWKRSLEKKVKPIFVKDITKVCDHFALKKYSSSNTLMVDDEPYKCLLNPPNTAIFPTAYKVEMVNDRVLAPKGELWKFLDGLADADNVPSYVKEHQIGQPAITESHSDWNLYSKIKHRFAK